MIHGLSEAIFKMSAMEENILYLSIYLSDLKSSSFWYMFWGTITLSKLVTISLLSNKDTKIQNESQIRPSFSETILEEIQ